MKCDALKNLAFCNMASYSSFLFLPGLEQSDSHIPAGYHADQQVSYL